MTNATIRPAAANDLQEILHLYRHLNPSDPEIDPATAAGIWNQLINSTMTCTLVAELHGELVGSCTITIVPNLTRGARPYALIENVVTRTEQRRCGIGTAILTEALAHAWRSNCYKVMLATGSQRAETLKFYEKAGFTKNAKTFFEAKPL